MPFKHVIVPRMFCKTLERYYDSTNAQEDDDSSWDDVFHIDSDTITTDLLSLAKYIDPSKLPPIVRSTLREAASVHSVLSETENAPPAQHGIISKSAASLADRSRFHAAQVSKSLADMD
ncbi:MAG: hypothetical protein MHM6MM_007619 [Cercozoa sp. M6MM]